MEKPQDIASHNIAYWSLRPFWEDCLNLAEPLPDTLVHYLNKFEKEDQAEFAARCQRLAQINILDIIVESYCAMLFSTSVQIKAQNHQDAVNRFVNCCNQTGDSLLDFTRETIMPSALLYGNLDVLVDMPEQADDVQTLAQQTEAGLDNPYCYVIPPLNRVYWKLDEAGNYTEFRSEDILDTQIQSTLQLRDHKQITVWTLDEIAVFDSNGETVKERPNPYGLIPAVTVTPLASKRFGQHRLGKSVVQDVIALQKRILNVMSLIYDFHENANFALRILKQDTDNQDEAPTEGELSEGGNKRGMIIRGKGSDYFYASPDAAGVDAMMRYLETLIERSYQSVSMPSDSNVNKTHQTGQTIRSNQAVLFNKLSSITKHGEKALKGIVEMALRVQNIDPAEAQVTVQWDTNFAYESFVNALEQLSLLKQTVADMSPLLVLEFTKKVVAPQLYSSGKLNEIEAQLDKWVVDAPKLAEQQQTNLQAENTQLNAANKISDE